MSNFPILIFKEQTMYRMSYYFLTVKRKCKHIMDVTVSLAINGYQRYNTFICLYELRLYP